MKTIKLLNQSADIVDRQVKKPEKSVFQTILELIKAKKDKGEQLSMKDALFAQIADELKSLNRVDEQGKVTPLEKRAVIGGMEFIPFSEYPIVGNNKRWTGIYAPLLNSPSDKPNLTPIGEAIGLETMYAESKELAELFKEIDDDLYWFEGSELYPKGLFRSIYEPVMLLTRIVQWNAKYYKRKPVPKGALPPLPKHKKKGILRLIKLTEVVIENIHANVGFNRLVRLVEKGKLLADSQLYKDLLMEAQMLMVKLSVDQILGPGELRALIPPHAIGKRNQGLARAIVMVAKVIFLIESTWAQPLQDYLEKQPWYAGGDRKVRLDRMTRVINGPPGTCLVDGDDFIIKLKNGKVMAGDYSSYESSVRDIDHTLIWDWIVELFSGLKKTLVYNLGRASGFADFVTGIGIAVRSPLHGIDSGRATTHTEESILNFATLQASSWQDVDSIVRDLTSYGRIMRSSAQHESSKWAFLAKLACDGKKIFGSVVRAYWGLCMPEDPPGLEFEQNPNLFWASRSVAILSNAVGNPGWDKLFSMIMSHYGQQLKESLSKESKSAVVNAALQKMDKTRRFGRDVRGGVIERKNIVFVYKEIKDWQAPTAKVTA